eukprot:scaffold993_cov393-Prasinococcus_capsulatus_cf.AAC.14
MPLLTARCNNRPGRGMRCLRLGLRPRPGAHSIAPLWMRLRIVSKYVWQSRLLIAVVDGVVANLTHADRVPNPVRSRPFPKHPQ